MDEITMFSMVRPAPPTPSEADAMRAAGRARLADTPRSGGAPGRRLAQAPGRRLAQAPGRRLAVTAVASASVAAAVAATVALTHGTPAPIPRASIVTADWAVQRAATGLVTVTMSRAFGDPAGLEQALRSEGITMIIKLNPFRTFNGTPGYGCAYTNLAREPDTMLNTVASAAPD